MSTTKAWIKLAGDILRALFPWFLIILMTIVIGVFVVEILRYG